MQDKIKAKISGTILSHPLTLPFYLPTLLYAFSSGVLIPILPLYAADFDISYGLIGLVLAGDALGLLLGDLPAGMLLRRLGNKRVMLLGLGAAILSTVALFWAGSIPVVILCRVVTGFSMALFNVSRHMYIANNVLLPQRGRAIALFGGIHRIGLFGGPAIGGIVGTAYGLRAPFLLFGVVGVIALGMIAVFLPADAEGASQKSERTGTYGGHLFSAFKAHYRILASAGAGQLFAQMIRAGRGSIIPLYASDVLGLSTAEIGFVLSFASAIDMVLFYPAGWIMDNLGRKYAIVPGFAGQAIGMALVPFTSGVSGLLFATGLMGFANGLTSGTMMTLGSDLAPQEERGEFLGMWRLIGDVGATGGPLIVGGIAEIVMLQTAAGALAAAGLTAAMIFAFLVPETLREKRKVKIGKWKSA